MKFSRQFALLALVGLSLTALACAPDTAPLPHPDGLSGQDAKTLEEVDRELSSLEKSLETESSLFSDAQDKGTKP